jgi:hypothetical protein
MLWGGPVQDLHRRRVRAMDRGEPCEASRSSVVLDVSVVRNGTVLATKTLTYSFDAGVAAGRAAVGPFGVGDPHQHPTPVLCGDRPCGQLRPAG